MEACGLNVLEGWVGEEDEVDAARLSCEVEGKEYVRVCECEEPSSVLGVGQGESCVKDMEDKKDGWCGACAVLLLSWTLYARVVGTPDEAGVACDFGVESSQASGRLFTWGKTSAWSSTHNYNIKTTISYRDEVATPSFFFHTAILVAPSNIFDKLFGTSSSTFSHVSSGRKERNKSTEIG